jgi:hypothetical protein
MVLASGDQPACIAFIGNKGNFKAFVIGSGQNSRAFYNDGSSFATN